MNLPNLIVAGVPLILVVTGLVQFFKQKLEWSGKKAEVLAYVLGLVIGFGYHVYSAVEPVIWNFNFVFEGLIFGAAIGLIATGIYDAYGDKTSKPLV